MILWRRCATLLFLLPCAFAQGQRTIPPIAGLPPPRTPRCAVQVDALVLDGAGNPISGLEQKDFTVRDDNQPIAREISGCLREAAGFYSLSFRGAAAESGDEFHAIEVKLDKPGFPCGRATATTRGPRPLCRGKRAGKPSLGVELAGRAGRVAA